MSVLKINATALEVSPRPHGQVVDRIYGLLGIKMFQSGLGVKMYQAFHLACRRHDLGLKRCGFKYVGKLWQWLYAVRMDTQCYSLLLKICQLYLRLLLVTYLEVKVMVPILTVECRWTGQSWSQTAGDSMHSHETSGTSHQAHSDTCGHTMWVKKNCTLLFLL